MGKIFPDIKMVALEDLVVHETECATRTAKLRERIRADGFLKNPVVVGLASETRPKYLLLDGVHRINALKSLGCKDVVAQLVDYSDEDVKLETWHQLIRGVNPDILLEEMRRTLRKRIIKESVRAKCSKRKRASLMRFLFKNGDSYVVQRHSSLIGGIQDIAKILGKCTALGTVIRVSEEEAESLLKRTHDATAVIFIPKLEKRDIIKVALSKLKLPAGITRHIVPSRALGLFVDLALLKVELPTDEKSKLIQAIVNQRLDDERVRFYAEPVFVFSE